MRDDSQKWVPSLGAHTKTLTHKGLEIAPFYPACMTMISGSVPGALALSQQTIATGWPIPVAKDHYALRLRRDRILVVNGPDLTDGWHAQENLAVSDVTDGYEVFTLSGSLAFEVLQRGTEITLSEPSNSVARKFFGHATLIYALSTPNSYRIHVARGFGDDLFALLSDFADQIEP